MQTSRSTSALILAGATNFRSLAGLRSKDGRVVRPHVLMRCERLADLTAEDWQRLAMAELTTICDLRSAGERQHHPNPVPAGLGMKELYFDVTNDLRANKALLAQLVADPTEAGATAMMITLYRGLPRHLSATLRSMGELLATRGAPVLVHCAAGKDRTGFAVASILYALDIPRDAIYADYLASRGWVNDGQRAALAVRLSQAISEDALPAVLDPILTVKEAYLDAAFAAAAEEYGSFEQYLEQAAGWDSTRIQQLRDRMLV